MPNEIQHMILLDAANISRYFFLHIFLKTNDHQSQKINKYITFLNLKKSKHFINTLLKNLKPSKNVG